MRRVVWSASARDELRRIRDYIGQFNPAAARRMAIALVAAAESLTTLPDTGRPTNDGYRELTIIWPYVIRYRVEADIVLIMRVRHGARRPSDYSSDD